MNWLSKLTNTLNLTSILLVIFISACGNNTEVKSEVSNQELPNLSVREDGTIHEIREFNLTDQDGKIFSSKTLDGKIYVADFFFTTCPSICPKMTGNMKNAFESFKNDSTVYFVSISIDPEFDTPEILTKYAEEKGYNEFNWRFLTGDKDLIYTICEEDYMAYAMPSDTEPGGYIHSGFLILVDPNGHIRGAFDGTSLGKSEDLVNDILKLKTEFSIN